MDEQRQREIADGLRQGNVDDWRALYESFSALLWQHVARRLGPNGQDVADVVQESLLAAARSAHGFDAGRGSLWNWLRGIANNQISLHFRQRSRQNDAQRLSTNSASHHGRLQKWLDDTVPPIDLLEQAETAELVRSTLSRLSSNYADLLTAKYVDGLSIDQIAADAGSTTSGISSKLARARRAFRDAFDAQPQEHGTL